MIDDVSHTALIGAKSLRIRFVKIDGFIRIYVLTRYLVFLGSKKYDAICNRIRYLISLKSSIGYVFSHFYAKVNVDSCDSSPIDKILTLNHVIILIKLVLNKDKNHYYYKIFLAKCSHQLPKK